MTEVWPASALAAIVQLSDTSFPSGAFGHSFGLETAIVDGRVTDADGLRAWIAAYLLDTCATLDGAAMALVMRDPALLRALDGRLIAAQPNAEIRRATTHLARATLDTYDAMGITDDTLAAYRAQIAGGRCAGVHPIAVALGYRALGMPVAAALAAHATTIVGACVSVAARAVPLGQRDVARVRWQLRPHVERFVALAAAAHDIDDLRASAVGCEIDGLQHRRLPARLFAS